MEPAEGKNALHTLFLRYRQQISFVLVGILNTGVDFLVFSLLHKLIGIGAVISQGISYFAGVVNSYILNRTLTFRVKNNANYREFLKFIVVNIVSWGASVLIIYVFEKYIPLNIYIGKVAASLCALIINFSGSKLFVFKADT